jgi:hypothetical protein
MPAIDKGQDSVALLDGDAVRPLVMMELEARGYSVDDPRCAEDAHAGGSSKRASRWLLTVTYNGSWRIPPGQVVGGFLTASLFDTEAGKEVWRNSANTKYMARLANGLGAGGINYNVPNPVAFKTEVFKSALGPVLGKVEKRGKAAAPLAITSWAPISVRTGIFSKVHGEVCEGILEAKAATVSFTPDHPEGKCKKYQISMARSEIKSYGAIYFGNVFELTANGVGRIRFSGAVDEKSVNYLFASLGSGR